MFITTYNCHGVKDMKSRYIQHILKKCDIIFIQEHWLLKNKLHLLQNITNDHIVFGKSSINDNELFSGRPHGGCAIFLNKHIKCTVKHIDVNSDRICAILADYNIFINL